MNAVCFVVPNDCTSVPGFAFLFLTHGGGGFVNPIWGHRACISDILRWDCLDE